MQKTGIAPGPCAKIHFLTTFPSNRIRILATQARIVTQLNSRAPSSWPPISVRPFAQSIAEMAHSCTKSPSANSLMHTKADMSQPPVGMYRRADSYILPCTAGNFFSTSRHLSYFGGWTFPLLFFDNLVVYQNHRVVLRDVCFDVSRNLPKLPRSEAVSWNIPGTMAPVPITQLLPVISLGHTIIDSPNQQSSPMHLPWCSTAAFPPPVTCGIRMARRSKVTMGCAEATMVTLGSNLLLVTILACLSH